MSACSTPVTLHAVAQGSQPPSPLRHRRGATAFSPGAGRGRGRRRWSGSRAPRGGWGVGGGGGQGRRGPGAAGVAEHSSSRTWGAQGVTFPERRATDPFRFAYLWALAAAAAPPAGAPQRRPCHRQADEQLLGGGHRRAVRPAVPHGERTVAMRLLGTCAPAFLHLPRHKFKPQQQTRS